MFLDTIHQNISKENCKNNKIKIKMEVTYQCGALALGGYTRN